MATGKEVPATIAKWDHVAVYRSDKRIGVRYEGISQAGVTNLLDLSEKGRAAFNTFLAEVLSKDGYGDEVEIKAVLVADIAEAKEAIAKKEVLDEKVN